jgi:hypothetical protein
MITGLIGPITANNKVHNTAAQNNFLYGEMYESNRLNTLILIVAFSAMLCKFTEKYR